VSGVTASLVAGLLLAAPLRPAFQDPAASQAEQPVITGIRFEGVTVYAPEELQERLHVAAGARLPAPPPAIAAELQKRYAADGYIFAEASASVDADGALSLHVDEGRIDAIEFRGVGAVVERRLRETFAMQAGDIFNRAQANRALHQALESAQGAVERAEERVFTLERDNNRRVLHVNLRTRTDRSRPFVGTQGREDWYSPVDGFNPAFGFQTTIFDVNRFNHAYASIWLSYKFAAERVGYSGGFERPFFDDGVLQAGASIHDMSASDDRWRLSGAEQSLAAFAFRNTFRDYYRRKGWQLHAALRPFAEHEWLVAWRDESHAALENDAEFGLFRDAHPFRANAAAQSGDLRSLVLGYTFDSRGLTRETPGERYRRHQLDDLFTSESDPEHGVRVEWRSEFAPSALEHDFDFSRHIVNARVWLQTAPSRLWTGRAIVGFADGTLPPQRVFALGGVGSVHGYGFKEASGEGMLLLNGEFRQRFGRSPFGGLVFIDAGRVYEPLAGSSGDWLRGVGLGLELPGSARLEFGWRLDDVPDSLQVLFRLNAPW